MVENIRRNHLLFLNIRAVGPPISSPLVPQSVSKASVLWDKNQILKNHLYCRSKSKCVCSFGQKMEVSGSPLHRQLILG